MMVWIWQVGARRLWPTILVIATFSVIGAAMLIRGDIGSLQFRPSNAPPADSVSAPPAFQIPPNILESSDVANAVTRLLEAECVSLGEWMHRWRVAAILGDRYPADMLSDEMQIVFSSVKFHSRFPNAPSLFLQTPFGWEVRRKRPGVFYARWQGESHADQFLAICAQVGVPLKQIVRTEAGQITLRDLLISSRKAFTSDQDPSWSLIAYAAYIPEEPKWQNRFGDHFSVESVAKSLLEKNRYEGPCAGTHKHYALAFLLEADRQHDLVSGTVRNTIERYLRRSSEALTLEQKANGSWDIDWAGSDAANGINECSLDTLDTLGTLDTMDAIDRQILVTAHHVAVYFRGQTRPD